MNRPLVRNTLLLLAAGLAGVALANAVLLPGEVHGTATLSGWSFQSSSVQMYGAFSGSTSFSGDTYTVTLQGDQTYTNTYLYRYASNGANFYHYSYEPVTVPAGGSVDVDLSRAGGTVVPSVTATGGTVTGGYIYASGSSSSPQESWQSQIYYSTNGSTRLPGIADDTVNVSGYVDVGVVDDLGAACTVRRDLTSQTVSLPEGQDTAVAFAVDVTGTSCSGAIYGEIAFDGLPNGVGPDWTYAIASGRTYGSDSTNGNHQDYEITGLAEYSYYTYAYSWYSAYSQYYYYPYAYVNLASGEREQRDFTAQGAEATGGFSLTGPRAGEFMNGYVQLSGSDNAYTYTYVYEGDDTWQGALSEGTWRKYNTSMTYGSWSGSEPYVSYVYTYDYTPDTFAVPASGTVDAPAVASEASEAVVVFDVIEAAGAATIGITNPTIYATKYDGSEQVSVQSYRYVSNAATPSVNVIGPPGTYTFDAYATVAGSYSRFASGTVELGGSVDTGTGTDVVITPTNGDGDPTPITLVFDTVTGGGSTTASTTDVGPAAPTGYEVLSGIDGDSYVSLSTDATFSGNVDIALTYDADALGLTAAEEGQLALQQYVCESGTCAWTDITTDVDPTTGTITGSTDTINGTVLALTLSSVTLVPPTDTCFGSDGAPAQLETDAGECSVSADNDNQLAGGCAGGGGGLASCTFDGEESLALGLGTHGVDILATAVDGSTATCTSTVEVVDLEMAEISCPTPATVECDGAATPYATEASCEDNCGDCTPTCGSDSYALGTSSIACNAVDAAGNTSSCNTSVEVVDTQAPGVTVSVSPSTLWAPNHKLRAIAISTTSSDACDAAPAVTCTATSNEPDNGLGDGDTAGDIKWQNGSLFLRAERSGTGNGRVYTVTCTATDDSGNETTSSTTVTVPHNQ
ncbi:MAG: hypothetical protein Q8P18_01360 [Pseudomonadota bacterium]|nr:hypothetical protein [Pseudomonadota bacterium]